MPWHFFRSDSLYSERRATFSHICKDFNNSSVIPWCRSATDFFFSLSKGAHNFKTWIVQKDIKVKVEFPSWNPPTQLPLPEITTINKFSSALPGKVPKCRCMLFKMSTIGTTLYTLLYTFKIFNTLWKPSSVNLKLTGSEFILILFKSLHYIS